MDLLHGLGLTVGAMKTMSEYPSREGDVYPRNSGWSYEILMSYKITKSSGVVEELWALYIDHSRMLEQQPKLLG